MSWNSPDRQLLRAIVKKDCCLFLGSGFSAAVAGYSNATSLRQELLRGIPKAKLSGTNQRQLSNLPLDVLSDFYERALDRRHLLELLWNLFNDSRCKIEKERESTLRLLTDFNWRTIYTTNYDPLIERTLRLGKIPARVITQNSDLRKLTYNETPVIKLHGCINEVASDDITPIIITESDYFDQRHRRNREILYSRLSSDLAHNTFLFVGYGMKEESFRRLWASVFFALTQARGSSQIYDFADNRSHYAVTINATSLDKSFWSSYGVQLLEEKLEDFADRLCDYKEKAFSSLQGEYFPDGEYFFLTSSSPTMPTSDKWSPPLHRYQYDQAVWELSHAAFIERENLNSLKKKLHSRASTNLQLKSLLLTDAKIPPEAKESLAKSLAEEFSSTESSSPGEIQEQAVSALPYIWGLLRNDKSLQQAVSSKLVQVLESDDFLATYKATLALLEISHGLLEEQILSFIQAHLRDGPSDTLDPALTKPIARLLRQVGYSLLSSPNTWGRNSPKILDFLEQATNPLLAWEIGAVAATKCRWDNKFEHSLIRQIDRVASRKCPMEHFTRYIHILSLRKDLAKHLAADSLKLYNHCRTLLKVQGGESNDILMARTGLTIQLLETSSADAFVSRSIPHLKKSLSDHKWRTVALSIPTAVRNLEKKEDCIMICAKLISELPDNPLSAQPLLYILLDTIFKTGQYEETKGILEKALTQLRASQEFQEDDWARFVYVGLTSIYLQKAKLNTHDPLLESIKKHLEYTFSSPNERLTLRGLALKGIISKIPDYLTNSASLTCTPQNPQTLYQPPNFRSISS